MQNVPTPLAGALHAITLFNQEKKGKETEIRDGLPDCGETLTLYMQEGRYLEALPLLEVGLAREPSSHTLLSQHGFSLYQLGRWNEALASFEAALSRFPDDPDFFTCRGLVLQHLGREADALASHEKAIALRPNHPEAFNNAGNALLRLERFSEAITRYTHALSARPEFPEAFNGRGLALMELGRYKEALADLDAALAIRPDYAEALNGRGIVLHHLGRREEGLDSLDAAITVRPSYLDPHSNRGNLLQSLDRLEEAIVSYDEALRLSPDFLEALHNKGRALLHAGRLDEARSCFDIVLARKGVYPEAEMGRSVCCLLQGDLAQGWLGYEQRASQKGAPTLRHKDCPRWTGKESLLGCTLLLHAEQGLGDTIQFVRYLPLLAERGARIILEAPRRLRALLGSLRTAVEIIEQDHPRPAVDFQCPLLSLPLAFGTSQTTIPWQGPYLFAEPNRVEIWAKRLQVALKPAVETHPDHLSRARRIGIVWQGNPSGEVDFGRSIPLEAFAPLSRIPGVQLVSLQKGFGTEQIQALPSKFPLTVLGPDFDDGPDAFLDSAAVIQSLDILVTSDTAMAHLAGALGKPVWIALKHVPDWRWMMDRADSPWYPSARLFRQQTRGDWESVFQKIAAALRDDLGLSPRPFSILPKKADQPSPRGERSPPGDLQCPSDDAAECVLKALALAQQNRCEEALALLDQPLTARSARALSTKGYILSRVGRWEEALSYYDAALAIRPEDPDGLTSRGIVLQQMGSYLEALESHQKALKLIPDHPDALNNCGNSLLRLRKFEQALDCYQKALVGRPEFPEALNGRGHALMELGRPNEALASFQRALQVRPGYADAMTGCGNAFRALDLSERALECYAKAAGTAANALDAHLNKASLLAELQRTEEALRALDDVLAIGPQHVGALVQKATLLNGLGRGHEALEHCDAARQADPAHADAWAARGACFFALRQYEEAMKCFDEALRLQPNRADMVAARGIVLVETGRVQAALDFLSRALELMPYDASLHLCLGNVLLGTQQFDEALRSYENAFALKPGHKEALNGILWSALKSCNWSRIESMLPDIHKRIAGGQAGVLPFAYLAVSSGPAWELDCARQYAAHRNWKSIEPRFEYAKAGTGSKIRLAYLSSDYHSHATAALVTRLIELHDREQFEVFGISFGSDDRSSERHRLSEAFDKFFDVRTYSDNEVASLINDLGIDVAVDLKGYTKDARPAILARRPAPIQVNYLGYPGTLGLDFIDYILADEIVAPRAEQPFYAEKIVHLPGSYQVNSHRAQTGGSPDRTETGLPTEAFVFCCFNNNYKITRQQFESWMRILLQCENSVLWLLNDNATAQKRLRCAARAAGVNPNRIIFAERAPMRDHLERHKLADLFLDTLPVNAHTTASDALWCGVPVLTRRGESFAGRVAASLLSALGMTELVMESEASYEKMAVDLAHDRTELARVRKRLAEARATSPLFDTDRFRRNVEAAYKFMVELWRRGESPKPFSVQEAHTTDYLPTPNSDAATPEAAQLSNAILETALARHRAGDLEKARELCNEVLTHWPSHFDALHLTAVLHSQQGYHAEALKFLERSLAVRPESREALRNKALILFQAGLHAEALRICEAVLELNPDDRQISYKRATCLEALARRDEALDCINGVIARWPDYAEAWNARGVFMRQAGDLDGALASYNKALSIAPDYADALNSRANVLRSVERFEEALADYDRALSIQPAFVEALNGRGLTLLGYQQQLQRRGVEFLGENRFQEALATIEQALAIRSDDDAALNNRGLAVHELGRFEEALASYEKALQLRPDYPDALNNRANTLFAMGRFDEAIQDFDRAVALDPANAEHRFNRSLLLLIKGSFAEGWQEYEWRRLRKNKAQRISGGVEWTGQEVNGKRVLLYHEQGLGDTLQFARFAETVADMGAEVVLDVQPQIAALLKGLSGPCLIRAATNGEVGCDLHAPLMSVPAILQHKFIPAAEPYLRADPGLIETWRALLPPTGLKVGLAWQGNRNSPIDKGRSIPAKELSALGSMNGVHFISLQKGTGTGQGGPDHPPVSFLPLPRELDAGSDAFVDTAAVMMSTDLIITSDTSIAHLAGALGRPVWIILKKVPDWRWLLERTDSPWYPTARLFRQRVSGDWLEVITQVASELENLRARHSR
jgi:predicted O-linked N-acetylglucosamine transferase (SPINDLY family)